MKHTLPEYFFDLSSFAHKKLFSVESPVWEALNQITQYIKQYSRFGLILSPIPEDVTLVTRGPIYIGKETKVEPGAYIEGPCIIGNHCEVRHGAYVRPGVITGDHCVIGHATEVKHSILLDHAKTPHFNYVGDSILGSHVNLGAGVICANFRLDGKEVKVHANEQVHSTGLRKLGAVIGDKSQLGCNTVVNPGVLIKKGSLFRSCTPIQTSNVE